jgi:hypothetical protein
MNTITLCLALAVSLGVGTYLGARLARSQYGIPKSIGLAVLLFIGTCIAATSLQEHPSVLACAIACVASVIAAWIGAKSMPDYLRSAHLSHADVFPGNRQNSGFGSPGSSDLSKGIAAIAQPIARAAARKPALPSRVTPTGKTIRLVTTTDAKVGGKRRKGHLRAAN